MTVATTQTTGDTYSIPMGPLGSVHSADVQLFPTCPNWQMETEILTCHWHFSHAALLTYPRLFRSSGLDWIAVIFDSCILADLQ